MEFDVLYDPAYSVLRVRLSRGESIEAEPGALMMYRGEVEVKTRGRGLLRAFTTGESFFVNTYRAASDDVEIWLAPPVPGDIKYIPIEAGRGIIVNDKAYLASHGSVEHRVVWRGLRGVFGGGGLMWLHMTGNGGVWVNSFGAIMEVEVEPGNTLVVDNLHLVAMDDTLEYEIRKFGSLKTFMFGGEGFVFKVRGHGRLFLQTRNPSILYASSRR